MGVKSPHILIAIIFVITFLSIICYYYKRISTDFTVQDELYSKINDYEEALEKIEKNREKNLQAQQIIADSQLKKVEKCEYDLAVKNKMKTIQDKKITTLQYSTYETGLEYLNAQFKKNIQEDTLEYNYWVERRFRFELKVRNNETFPSPYCFVHLPKTAGTSLFRSAYRILPKTKILQHWTNPSEEIVNMINYTNSNSLKIIGGHLSYGFHKWFKYPPLAEYTYFTILREPVSRVISHYVYHLKTIKDPNHAKTENKTFSEWIKTVKYGQNIMTLLLCGAEYSAWWNANSTEFNLLPPNPDPPNNFIVTEKHYKQARKNLMNMIVFTQDTIDDSLDFFDAFMDIQFPKLAQENVSKSPNFTATPEDIAVIKMYNHWDEKLYTFGKLLYEQQRLILNKFRGYN